MDAKVGEAKLAAHTLYAQVVDLEPLPTGCHHGNGRRFFVDAGAGDSGMGDAESTLRTIVRAVAMNRARDIIREPPGATEKLWSSDPEVLSSARAGK